MNKTATAILAVAIIATATITTYFAMQPATTKASLLPSTDPPTWQVKVTGDLQPEKNLTLQDLLQMPLTNVTATIDGEDQTFVGVPLYDFCNQTGVNWDAGTINLISNQGNEASINIYQAYNSSAYPYYYNNNVITLAFAKDGEWLTNETGGPIRLIAPYFSAATQVRSVVEVHVDDYAVSISGAVSNPLTITGKNLTVVQPRSVYAEFAPSEKRNSTWTGLPLMNLLQLANVSSRAERITIIAIDGYQKNYTLEEVANGQMMLGYQENGNPLPHTQGGPFRLFAPTEQYKWAQYWVKYVAQIIVY
jgi:DMSO/TMAO reductase YedYZ molybdopterin-dependent catalytic subunit